MKRNMDLVRNIMLALEESSGQPDLHHLLNEQVTESVLGHHLYLLYQAGLAEGMCHENGIAEDDSAPFVVLNRLTWKGHDFIEAARNDTRWNEAKRIATTASSGMTIAVLTEILAGLAQAAIQKAMFGSAG